LLQESETFDLTPFVLKSDFLWFRTVCRSWISPITSPNRSSRFWWNRC
jgi:hypothetical protein